MPLFFLFLSLFFFAQIDYSFKLIGRIKISGQLLSEKSFLVQLACCAIFRWIIALLSMTVKCVYPNSLRLFLYSCSERFLETARKNKIFWSTLRKKQFSYADAVIFLDEWLSSLQLLSFLVTAMQPAVLNHSTVQDFIQKPPLTFGFSCSGSVSWRKLTKRGTFLGQFWENRFFS